MTTYRYLGWGKTNENGIAKLDHNSEGQKIEHSYTGTGAGEIDVLASLDNPVDEGSIVSRTYNVWDTNFGDGGVTGNTNGGFYYTQDQTVVSRQTDNTGTTVTNLTSSLQTIRVNKPNTSIDEKDWVAPLNIEFDILSYTGILYLQLWKSNNTYENVSVNLSNFLTGVSNPHVKVLVADGKMKVYVNDELKTDLVLTFGGLFGIRLLLSNSASFKYKNFFVYGMSKDYCVVTSQNNIVVTGEDLSITGQLYLNDELALNKTLDVYKDGSKVGTASTGDTGTATYTYTGVGDGEVEFQFKYGSILSEIYEVLDYIKYDKGILDDPQTRNIYDNVSANALTRTTEYTSLKEVTTGTDAVAFISDLPSDYTIDFELYQVDGLSGNGVISLYSDSTYKNYFGINHISGSVGTWVNLRLTVTEGSATLTDLDIPSRTKTQTFTGTVNRIRFGTVATTTELRWKNVRIYPI